MKQPLSYLIRVKFYVFSQPYLFALEYRSMRFDEEYMWPESVMTI